MFVVQSTPGKTDDEFFKKYEKWVNAQIAKDLLSNLKKYEEEKMNSLWDSNWSSGIENCSMGRIENSYSFPRILEVKNAPNYLSVTQQYQHADGVGIPNLILDFSIGEASLRIGKDLALLRYVISEDTHDVQGKARHYKWLTIKCNMERKMWQVCTGRHYHTIDFVAGRKRIVLDYPKHPLLF
jgi:hypothetical protein